VYTVVYTAIYTELAVYKAMKRDQIKKRPMSDTTLATLEPEAKEYANSTVAACIFASNQTAKKHGYTATKNPTANGHG